MIRNRRGAARVSATSLERGYPCPLELLRRSSVALIASIACLGAALVAAPTEAQPAHHRLHPSAVPASTPNILDGRTYAIAEVGTKVFVGGTFTTAQNPGTSAVISTPYILFKYDRLTGQSTPPSRPQLDAQVNAIVPSPDGSALYLGGAFKKARTTNVRNVIKIDTSTGALITAFKNPSPNGTRPRPGAGRQPPLRRRLVHDDGHRCRTAGWRRSTPPPARSTSTWASTSRPTTTGRPGPPRLPSASRSSRRPPTVPSWSRSATSRPRTGSPATR